MNLTGIAWTVTAARAKGHTWNPVVGCSEHSPGCRNCWSKELVATRMAKNPKLPMYADLARITDGGKAQWTGVVRLMPDRLGQPISKRAPTTIFVCDMSDLFHADVPFSYIAAVFGVMAAAPRHVFQVLTKRADRMAEFFAWMTAERLLAGFHLARIEEITMGFGPLSMTASPRGAMSVGMPWPLPNVHLGVSVDDRAQGGEPQDGGTK